MRRIVKQHSDVVLRLGERTASAVFRLENDTIRKHKTCFRHYTALDMLNAALYLVSLLSDEWGMSEARLWLDSLHWMPSNSDAAAWRDGELVVRLGGLDEEDTLTAYLWELTAVLTENVTLPEWAEEMIDDEAPHYHHSHTAVCTKWTSNNTQQFSSSEGSTPAKETEQTTIIINVMPGAVYNDIHDNEITN